MSRDVYLILTGNKILRRSFRLLSAALVTAPANNCYPVTADNPG